MTMTTLKNAYDASTLNNNLFEKAVKALAVSSVSEGANTSYVFADGSSLDCDTLNPFTLTYATFASGDFSIIAEFKAA